MSKIHVYQVSEGFVILVPLWAMTISAQLNSRSTAALTGKVTFIPKIDPSAVTTVVSPKALVLGKSYSLEAQNALALEYVVSLKT